MSELDRTIFPEAESEEAVFALADIVDYPDTCPLGAMLDTDEGLANRDLLPEEPDDSGGSIGQTDDSLQPGCIGNTVMTPRQSVIHNTAAEVNTIAEMVPPDNGKDVLSNPSAADRADDNRPNDRPHSAIPEPRAAHSDLASTPSEITSRDDHDGPTDPPKPPHDAESPEDGPPEELVYAAAVAARGTVSIWAPLPSDTTMKLRDGQASTTSASYYRFGDGESELFNDYVAPLWNREPSQPADVVELFSVEPAVEPVPSTSEIEARTYEELVPHWVVNHFTHEPEPAIVVSYTFDPEIGNLMHDDVLAAQAYTDSTGQVAKLKIVTLLPQTIATELQRLVGRQPEMARLFAEEVILGSGGLPLGVWKDFVRPPFEKLRGGGTVYLETPLSEIERLIPRFTRLPLAPLSPENSDLTSQNLLAHILSQPLPDKVIRDLWDPSSKYNHVIEREWNGLSHARANYTEVAHHVTSVDRNDYSSLDDFRRAIWDEIIGRELEVAFTKRFGQLLNKATPEQFMAFAEVFCFLLPEVHELSDNEMFNVTYFGRSIIGRSVASLEDPETGSADIAAAAQLAMQPLAYLADFMHTLNPTRLPRTVDRNIASHISNTLVAGSAEHLAMLTVCELLMQSGHPSFGSKIEVKNYKHFLKAGQQITTATLREIYRHEEEFLGIPQGLLAEQRIHTWIIHTLQDIVESTRWKPEDATDNRIANAILKLFGAKELQARHGGSLRGPAPANPAIWVARQITPALNDREGVVLDQLNPKDSSQLPEAFRRLLWAINPALLEKATHGPVTGNQASPLRQRMAYVEAVAKQWSPLS